MCDVGVFVRVDRRLLGSQPIGSVTKGTVVFVPTIGGRAVVDYVLISGRFLVFCKGVVPFVVISKRASVSYIREYSFLGGMGLFVVRCMVVLCVWG